MKKARQQGVGILAATAATVLVSAVARAQYPVGQDGHANDANNRVGSGGYNTQRPGSAVTSNDIVNRNVTGLSEFKGPVGSRDPRSFTGPAAGSAFDVWIRRSEGVPTPNSPNTNVDSNAPQPFYGQARFVAPPAGSVPAGFSGGYIGTVANSPSSLSNGLNVATENATGLQARTQSRDNLLLNAMLDPSRYGGLSNQVNQQDLYDNAAFFGQRTLAPGESEFAPQAVQLPDQANAEESALFRMRQEVRDTAGGVKPAAPNAPQNSVQTPQSPNGELTQPTSLAQPIDRPLTPGLGSVDNTALNAPLAGRVANDPLSATGTIPANVRERPSLVPPEMQSSLLQTLQQRLAKTNDVARAMADAHSNVPPPPMVKVKPPPTPGPVVGPATPDNSAGPVKVSSLAVGVHAIGLRDLLAGGEDLIKQGKYDQAIAKFTQAQRVAPNNPLAPLGRAHAELAGGYYSRAEADLRQVFRTDPELMLAQFDLASLISKERVDYLRNDLRTLAQSNPNSERPMFLLAYLDYNTGNSEAADKDIDGAEKRAGSADWAVRLLRQHWALPSNAKGTPANPNGELNK